MSALFSEELFQFFAELEVNNQREWFHSNKKRYLACVKQPMLEFLSQLSSRLDGAYVVSPKSLLRQHRDIRFSKDKSPYKTFTACFMYVAGSKKSENPHGYYLQIGAGGGFFGAGVYAPPAPNLLKIRQGIVQHPDLWQEVKTLSLEGNRLKRAPRGFDPNHPQIEDIKRKDFITSAKLSKKEIISASFLECFLGHCARSEPLMKFLNLVLV